MTLTGALAPVEKTGMLLAKGFFVLKRMEMGLSYMAVRMGS